VGPGWAEAERQRILRTGAAIRAEIGAAHGEAIDAIGARHRAAIEDALAALRAQLDRLRVEHHKDLERQGAVLTQALAGAQQDLARIFFVEAGEEPPDLDGLLAGLARGRAAYERAEEGV